MNQSPKGGCERIILLLPGKMEVAFLLQAGSFNPHWSLPSSVGASLAGNKKEQNKFSTARTRSYPPGRGEEPQILIQKAKLTVLQAHQGLS